MLQSGMRLTPCAADIANTCLTPVLCCDGHEKNKLTAVKSNAPDSGALAQAIQDAPVQVKRMRGQVDAAADSAALVIGASHIDDEKMARGQV